MNRLCARWGNGRAPPPWKNSVPAKLFRFTKVFTERCWSNRRSRHELFRIGQNGQAQPDHRAAAFAAFDHHPGSIAVEHLQTLGDVGHADSHTSKAADLLVLSNELLGRPHAHAVILHLDHEP